MDLGLKGRPRWSEERLPVSGGRPRTSGGRGLQARALVARGDALEQTAEEIRRLHGVVVVTIAGDATDPATPAKVAWAAERHLGQIDIAILNAGGPIASEATKTDRPNGAARSSCSPSPDRAGDGSPAGYAQTGWGRIVSIMSSGIRQPIPDLAYSNACRSALAAWLKTIGAEVIRDGVTVNGVVPGRLDTARVATLDKAKADKIGSTLKEVRAQSERSIPAGRYGQPDELAAYVAWLCSEPARYQTGTFVPIDGGMLRFLP